MTSKESLPAPGAGQTQANPYAALGAISALTMVANWTIATRSAVLLEIRDNETYKVLAPTWEEFCARHLPWARRTVDEDIHFLEVLGDEFLQAAGTIGLGRRHLRALAAAPAGMLPKAEGDEIVVGDERVPITNREQVVELLEELVAGQDRLRDRIKQGEAQLTEKENEVRELRREVKRRDDISAGRLIGEFGQEMVRVLRLLRRAADFLSDADPAKRPSPREVLAYYQAMRPAMDELVHYGGQYVTPDWARDPEAFERHMAELVEEVSVAEPGGAGDDDVDGADWGDEDELL